MEVKEFWEKRENIEASAEETTKLLGWQYTDVLYSFLGIYVIGLYAFDKESEENERKFRRESGGNIIFVGKGNQRLYSNSIIGNYINGNDENLGRLNELKELKEFLDVYNNIGNIIPIWPGGNESRGKFCCYDLPEFYFFNDKVKPWTKYLLSEYDNCFIEKNIENKGGLPKFLNKLSVDTYKKYLSDIKEIIDERKSKLDEILKSKASCSSIK